jgi:hypothetical protein
MRYVIDASVAVTAVVSRPLTSKALRLRQEYLSITPISETIA